MGAEQGVTPLSPGNDRFYAVAFDAQSRAYAAGHTTMEEGNTALAVARFEVDGVLDASFGQDGVASVDVSAMGTSERVRGVALQSDGRVVVAGVADDVAQTGTDLVVARFDAAGALDTTFGTGGVSVVDGGAGAFGWGVDVDDEDRIVVFGAVTPDGRTDNDRAILRFTDDGVPDASFATAGMFTLDVGAANANDEARNGFIQPDGKIVSAGYVPLPTPDPDVPRNHIALLRLNDDGTPDGTFDADGEVLFDPFTATSGMAEAYAVTRQSDGSYVTTGYGRSEATGPVDLVSFRFLEDGALDTGYGISGGVIFDQAGADDRGRQLFALPDNRLMMVGSSVASGSAEDAMIAVVTPDGAFDSGFGNGGYQLFDRGGDDEEFFGVALAPNGKTVAAVGYTSGGTRSDDDAMLQLLDVELDTAALSDDYDDRFAAVAADAQGRAVAVGFVADASGDHYTALARFTHDGMLDPTFGIDGMSTANLQASADGESASTVGFQSDGAIVVAGMVEDQTVVGTFDIFVARFDASGAPDASFGSGGVTRIGAGSVGLVWGLMIDPSDRIVLSAALPGQGRSDRDRAIIRLDADGGIDGTFATSGTYRLDVADAGADDNPRTGVILADGRIITSGYTALATPDPDVPRNHIVLISLNDDGTPDATFGTDGVVLYDPFTSSGGMAEAYGLVLQSGDRLVTTGYGRSEPAGTVDLLSFRFDVTGAADSAWATGGLFSVDLAGADDRGRGLVALSDDRVAMVGTGMQDLVEEDAMVLLLDPDGALVPAFGPGPRFFEFGGDDEEFRGAAVVEATSSLFVVGYTSGGSRANDDATLLVLPLP